MGKSLAKARVRAAAPDDRVPHCYFVFADGRLLRVGTGSTEAELVAQVPDIREVANGTGDGRLAGEELELGLHVRGPWVCVTERFGVNASLINTSTGAVRGLSRADYHSDVSSYSIGFLDRDGRILLVAQTQWNRLDVFDAETGANLTERDVFIRDSGRCDEHGGKIYDRSNYVDYFHSLLHVSPDSRHFLSNGWVWSPEVKGELHYDPDTGCLVALTDGAGCFVVSLNGDVVARVPDLGLMSPPSHGDVGSRYSGPRGWSYALQHRVFYRWLDGVGIEERALPTATQLAEKQRHSTP